MYGECSSSDQLLALMFPYLQLPWIPANSARTAAWIRTETQLCYMGICSTQKQSTLLVYKNIFIVRFPVHNAKALLTCMHLCSCGTLSGVCFVPDMSRMRNNIPSIGSMHGRCPFTYIISQTTTVTSLKQVGYQDPNLWSSRVYIQTF